jgi:hypothetical protein
VVTLVEVPARIEEHFGRSYAPNSNVDELEVTIDFDGEDPPDPLVGGTIDIGEAAAEALALALDPYPRAPGAVFDSTATGTTERPNPFGVLATFKKPS